MAMISVGILFVSYFVALFCEFVAPYDPDGALIQFKQVPPTEIHIIDDKGNWQLPFVYLHKRAMDPNTFAITNIEDKSQKFPIGLFVHGFKYSMPLIGETDIHLFGLPEGKDVQGVFLFGTDRIGRDMFSRIAYGARLSLSMGMVSVFLSLILGIMLGGISGLYGGAADTIIQRVIEFIRTIPTIPLYMTLSAALPVNWPIEWVYFGITMILALVGWTFLARVVRGRFLAMREEDFVMAARLNGSSEMRIILRHSRRACSKAVRRSTCSPMACTASLICRCSVSTRRSRCLQGYASTLASYLAAIARTSGNSSSRDRAGISRRIASCTGATWSTRSSSSIADNSSP
jgi:peptide/nickel transport system permease protein